MPYVQRPKVRKKEMQCLTANQVRGFLGHVPEDWEAFFLTAALTGMRVGELMAMRWKNLDLEGSRYHVVERIYKGLFDTPKSESSLRWVDLAPRVLDAFKSHRARQTAHRLRSGQDYRTWT